MLGDFNNHLNLEDRLGYAITLDKVASLEQCIRDCDPQDYPTCGPLHYLVKQAGR